MRSLIAVFVLLFGVSVACAEPVKSVDGKTVAEYLVPHITHTQHPAPPRIYPHTPDRGPGEFYYDGWGHPYRPRPYPPYVRPYSSQPHGHLIPRRRTLPQWNPWPEHRQNPRGQGGQGKGPMYRYYYGPGGWGFGIGPNITR